MGFSPSTGSHPGRQLFSRWRHGWCKDLVEDFEGDYYIFSNFLEREPHNRGHGWIGGDMGNPMISPNDPIFWMHHAQIDRIWSVWQTRNPGEKPFLDSDEKKLDPWEDKFDVDSIDDISNLGEDSYEYESPSSPA